MKIIVFGASGDTGTYFIKYLFENGFTKENEVIAVGTRKTTNAVSKVWLRKYPATTLYRKGCRGWNEKNST